MKNSDEVILQILLNLLFDFALHRTKEHSELHLDTNFRLADVDRAARAAAIEPQNVAVPAVLHVELRLKLVGDLFGRAARLLFADSVAFPNVDGRHDSFLCSKEGLSTSHEEPRRKRPKEFRARHAPRPHFW